MFKQFIAECLGFFNNSVLPWIPSLLNFLLTSLVTLFSLMVARTVACWWPPIYISSTVFPPELQTERASCLLGTSTWVSNEYLSLCNLSIVSFPKTPAAVSFPMPGDNNFILLVAQAKTPICLTSDIQYAGQSSLALHLSSDYIQKSTLLTISTTDIPVQAPLF